MQARKLTKQEAYEAVMSGADNIMVREYFAYGCEEHGRKNCWVGIQKGDEDENGEWPEEWTTFEAW